jgi:mannose-6-phosphate isomerase-like protein (cupin superfamily)
MSVKTNSVNAKTRIVDESLSITELIADPSFSFDLVIGSLNGDHPTVVNRVSDRAYYFLDGAGVVSVGTQKFDVVTGDTIKISRGTPHSLRGSMQYLIITSPPFYPANEEVSS